MLNVCLFLSLSVKVTKAEHILLALVSLPNPHTHTHTQTRQFSLSTLPSGTRKHQPTLADLSGRWAWDVDEISWLCCWYTYKLQDGVFTMPANVRTALSPGESDGRANGTSAVFPKLPRDACLKDFFVSRRSAVPLRNVLVH